LVQAAEARARGYRVEHVPARVCPETGGQYFAPEMVEKLQKIIWGQRKPVKVIETRVCEFGLTAMGS